MTFKIPGEDIIYSWYTIAVALFFGLIFGFRNYMRGPQCTIKGEIEKKVIIITGATSGIGFELAKEFAGRGATVIIGAKDAAKGKTVMKEVKTAAGSKTVEALKLDLSSFQSIRNFVKKFKSKYDSLHFLINNAGAMYLPNEKSVDGHEQHFVVNYLGHFLLTHLLLDTMKESAPAKIINISCPAYQLGEINLDDLNFDNRELTAADAFAQAKQAVMLFTFHLSKHLEGKNVTVNAVHPGVCNTDIYRNMPFMKSKIIAYSFSPVMWFMMKGSRDGAQTTLHCCINKMEEGVSGKLYKDCRISEPHENVTDPELAEKLWKVSAQLTGITLEESS